MPKNKPDPWPYEWNPLVEGLENYISITSSYATQILAIRLKEKGIDAKPKPTVQEMMRDAGEEVILEKADAETE